MLEENKDEDFSKKFVSSLKDSEKSKKKSEKVSKDQKLKEKTEDKQFQKFYTENLILKRKVRALEAALEEAMLDNEEAKTRMTELEVKLKQLEETENIRGSFPPFPDSSSSFEKLPPPISTPIRSPAPETKKEEIHPCPKCGTQWHNTLEELRDRETGQIVCPDCGEKLS